MGVVHEVHQGEGGDQSDTLMPALFSLGQLGPDERLFVLGRHLRDFKSQQGGANLQHSPEGIVDARTNPDPLGEDSNLESRR